jgi:hypothetical protein
VAVEEKDGVKTTTTTKTVVNADGIEETITTVATEVKGQAATTTETTTETTELASSYGYGYGAASFGDEYAYDSGVVSVSAGDLVSEHVAVEEKDGVVTTTTTQTIVNADGEEETITTVATEVKGEAVTTSTTTTETSETSPTMIEGAAVVGQVLSEQVSVEEKDGMVTTTTTQTVINAEGVE